MCARVLLLEHPRTHMHVTHADCHGVASRRSCVCAFHGLQVCYSWWCLSCLAILGRLHWIDQQALTRFILYCQVRYLYAQL